MVFFPKPGVHYAVRVSHKAIGEIGSYTLSAMNDGAPVPAAIQVQPAASGPRRVTSNAAAPSCGQRAVR